MADVKKLNVVRWLHCAQSRASNHGSSLGNHVSGAFDFTLEGGSDRFIHDLVCFVVATAVIVVPVASVVLVIVTVTASLRNHISNIFSALGNKQHPPWPQRSPY
jgi:Flp pilus assembly pilin Flp